MPKTTIKELEAEINRLTQLLDEKKAQVNNLRTKIEMVLKICGV